MKSIAFSRHENTFAFLGDQRIHDLFVALKTHFISAEDSAQSDKVNEDPFTNLPNSTFTNRDLRLTLNFTWSPYISQIMEDTLIELVVSYCALIFMLSKFFEVLLNSYFRNFMSVYHPQYPILVIHFDIFKFVTLNKQSIRYGCSFLFLRFSNGTECNIIVLS